MSEKICPECGSTSFESTAFNHGLGRRREYTPKNLNIYEGDSLLLSLRNTSPSTNCRECGYVLGSSNNRVIKGNGTWFKGDVLRFFHKHIAPYLRPDDMKILRKSLVKAYRKNKRELHKKPFSEAMDILIKEVDKDGIIKKGC